MGFDVYYQPDPSAEPWEPGDGLPLPPLPPLPEGSLCGIGGFFTVTHGLTLVREALHREPADENAARLRESFFACLNADRENALADYARCAKFIGGFVGVPQWGVVTHTTLSAEELRDAEADPDVQAFLGRLLASQSSTTRDTLRETEGAIIWALRSLGAALDDPATDDPRVRQPLAVAHEVIRVVGLHAYYVRRIGGAYYIDY